MSDDLTLKEFLVTGAVAFVALAVVLACSPMTRRTAVFPSHGMVNEKVSAARESFELVPLETGETGSVVGQRVYVGPLRNLGKRWSTRSLQHFRAGTGPFSPGKPPGECYQAPIAEGTYTVNYTPFNAKYPLAAWKSGLSSPE